MIHQKNPHAVYFQVPLSQMSEDAFEEEQSNLGVLGSKNFIIEMTSVPTSSVLSSAFVM